MNFKWNNLKPACCAKWLVLPTVYSDSLSYGEQLDKFCYQLNQLIENNNILPDFISEMIKEYINSGAIGEVVRDILADYILNVKYPPEGITPAVGDGSADDTAAIQGCIDYAAENGGVVYFPYGSYLTQPLTMKDDVSLFGFDRYSTKIVLKGGATNPLISGTVADLSIANLTLDGNSGIQVNDVNVVTITGTNVLFTNLIIKDGYTLVNYVGTGGHFQISDVVFGNAVEKCLLTAGNADVQCENVVFNHLSAVGGISVMDIGTDGGFFNVKSVATCNKCIVVGGNNNKISAIVENASIPVIDNGLQNNVEIFGISNKEFYSSDTTKEVNGSYSKHIGRTYTKAVDGNSSESYGGNYNKTVTGVTSETYNADKTVTEENESITGKKLIRNATDYSINATNTVSFAGKDVVLNPANALTYNKTPETINKFFKSVPMKNDDDVYNVLVENDLSLFTNGWVTPQDYGAKGDGVTDDTEAFRNAIEYCITNNKGLYVPAVGLWNQEGGYILSKPLNIDYPMVFICDPNVLMNWKNAHLNNDTTTTLGRNNSTKYESGYGVNIDYGTYGGHKGVYKFGVLQGDKNYTYPGGTVPSGNYWTGVRIANGDIIDFNAVYISYWNCGILVESPVNYTANNRIQFEVCDDCQTGIKLAPKNGNAIDVTEIYFNTIGICKYGVYIESDGDDSSSFSRVNNLRLVGSQIYVEYKNGGNLFNASKFEESCVNGYFDIRSLFNNRTSETTKKTGDTSTWYGKCVTGTQTISGNNDTFGALDSTFIIGVYNGPMKAGQPININIGGWGNEIINKWQKFTGIYDSPTTLILTPNEAQFNGGIGGCLPGRSAYVQWTTDKSYEVGDEVKLYGYCMCLTASGVTPMNAEEGENYALFDKIIKSDTYSAGRQFFITLKFREQVSKGYNFKFIVKVLDIN